MSAHSVAARVGRNGFSILVLGSATLVLVTFLSLALDGRGPSRLLFWLGLAGENNVGAWWSGMLLLLASAFALDGFARPNAAPAERRAWLALAAVLAILSFDEVASLHEYLGIFGVESMAALAVPLLALTGYAFLGFLRARVGPRMLVLLLLAFALLGTVPLQEYLQHSREWPDPVLYGLRAAVEEGIELAGILLLVAVTSRKTAALLEAGVAAFEFARHRAALLAAAAALAPVLVAATFVLPYPGGPADWLAAACYFGCALLLCRPFLRAPEAWTGPTLVLFAWYLAASIGSGAVRLEWDPSLLGVRVGVRGLFVALLLATAAPVLRRAGRPANGRPFAAGALVALVGAFWPQAQLLWCGLPLVAALYVYSIESALVGDRPFPAAPGVAVASKG